MVIKMSAFETLEKENRYTKSFKASLGCSAYNPARKLGSALFPSLDLPVLTQCAKSRQAKEAV
jgi:hypothetical protein